MDWSQSQTKLFRAMLYCFPAEFRHEYGAEMEQLFQDRLQSEPRWRLWLETLADIAISAPNEHCAILISDLKHEARALRAMPGFTAIILLVIALGIGATTSVFSVVNAVMLRSLPYSHPEQLVYLWSPNVNFKGVPEKLGPNVPDVYDWQRLAHSFSEIAMFTQRRVNVLHNGFAVPTGSAFVTGNFFRALGCKPLFGRLINKADDQPGHEHVAVVSYEFWHSQFDARPNVLGSQINVDRKWYTVVGVMPSAFGYPFDGDVPYDHTGFKQADLWLPIAHTTKQQTDRVNFASAIAIGRLKPGVNAAAAQAELQAIESRLQPAYPAMWRGWTVLADPLVQAILGPVQQMLWLLLGVVALVLLIAIGNVAGLLLARTTARAHELGIRTALGAERARIIRQLLTESLLLSCLGGALGIALSYALVPLLIRLNPGAIPRFAFADLDIRVLWVAVALSLVTGIAAGLLPAMSASAPSISDLLKRGGTRVAIGAHRGRFALIILEVALSVVLLTGSGLLIRSYLALQAIDTGFSPSTLGFQLPLDERYSTEAAQAAFYKALLAKLRDLPGFQYVGASTGLPLNDDESVTYVEIKGFGRARELIENFGITSEYRKALGTPLLRGRDFTAGDLNPNSGVVTINKTFAANYFAGTDPIGQQIRMGIGDLATNHWLTIVGVVGDIRNVTVDQQPKPEIFQPVEAGDSFAIRTSLPVQQTVSQVRATLHALDPALSVEIKTMHDRIVASNARRTFQTSLLTGFAALAVTLALVGLYGLMSYTVKQRTSEIGIRLAIGSPRSRILSLILGQGMRLTVLGLLIGLAASFALTRLVSSWLFGVQPNDPLTFALVPLFLLVVSACACLVPAWSATRIDPIQTLRQE